VSDLDVEPKKRTDIKIAYRRLHSQPRMPLETFPEATSPTMVSLRKLVDTTGSVLMPYSQPSKVSSQQHWTLSFKCHKSTILLLAQQSQSFTSIKQDLLDAIKATGLSDINGNPIPSQPEDIVLGVPIDGNDISKGWVNLEIPEFDEEAGAKGVKKGSVLNQSPLGAGLKDGAMLAFKFKDGEAQDEMDLDDHWDVVIPSYEDEDAALSQSRS